MRRPLRLPEGPGGQFLWNLLTFERMMTSEVIHLVYWAGLAVIGVGACGALGATIGVAIREGSILGILLALGVFAVGMLGAAVGILLWRSFCEFYVTIFKISEDLAVLRKEAEAERARQGRP